MIRIAKGKVREGKGKCTKWCLHLENEKMKTVKQRYAHSVIRVVRLYFMSMHGTSKSDLNKIEIFFFAAIPNRRSIGRLLRTTAVASCRTFFLFVLVVEPPLKINSKQINCRKSIVNFSFYILYHFLKI